MFAITKQCWNKDKCRCECKEFVDKGICDKGSIWNPSDFECGCDKSGDAGEYLEQGTCKYTKKVVGKSVKGCTENVEEEILAKIRSGE